MLNLDYLQSITGGDDTFTKEMLTIFQSEIPKNLALMKQHFEAGDLKTLKDAAHKYKASLLTLGMADTLEKIKKIEEECIGSKNVAVIKENLDGVLSESETTLNEINQWLAERA